MSTSMLSKTTRRTWQSATRLRLSLSSGARVVTRPGSIAWHPSPRSFSTTMSVLDPVWSWGDGTADASWRAHQSDAWKTWDPELTDKPDMYRLLTSAVIPRPIAFVSSLSASGVRNLAPFSYFSLISHKPPMVTVSVSVGKDTCNNVLATKEFVVNIVSEAFAQAMNSTSIDGPPELDEWEVSGLMPHPSETVKPVRVADAAFALECTLHHALPIGEEHMMLLVGHVRCVHARTDVLDSDGKTVDAAKLAPVTRLGGNTYARLGAVFDVPRPVWKKEGEAVAAAIAQKKSQL